MRKGFELVGRGFRRSGPMAAVLGQVAMAIWAASIVGCGSSSKDASTGQDSGGTTGGDSSSAGADTSGADGTTGADTTSDTAGDTGGAADTTGVDGSGTDAVGTTGDGGTAVGSPPSLASARARVVGRTGRDLLISATGTDSDKDAILLHLVFHTASGQPVAVFDQDWDGSVESAAGRVLFDTAPVGTNFAGGATLLGMYGRAPTIAGVTVSVDDAAGHRSNEMDVSLEMQPVEPEGASCDTMLVDNRCDTGLSCGGKPSTACQAGVAPGIDQLGYLRSPLGPRMVFAGSDADDDLTTMHLEFLNASGAPVTIDLDNDGTPESSFFDLDVSSSPRAGGKFFVENIAAEGFDTQVPKLGITPIDSQGHMGTRKTTSIATAQPIPSGQGCSPLGFGACVGGLVCSPGVLTASNACKAVGPLRTGACAAPLTLDPAKGKTTLFARVKEGASLWDPPPGCVPNDQPGRPETLVMLHIASATPALILTTALPETNFDTAVYAIGSCSSTGTDSTACNDDDHGFTSTLHLTNLAAGDYPIVVESVGPTGGTFGLTVRVP